jgi:anti-sigma regulatory factor (Ser/Thr protein kinase)
MKPLSEIKLAAKLENLEMLVQSVTACAKEHGISENKLPVIELGLEEAFVNICKYAYRDKEGDVEIKCNLDGDRFIIEIIDEGIPFDINSFPDPDITQNISERKIGGLGVFFIKKMADNIRYRREANRNILTIVIAQAPSEKT